MAYQLGFEKLLSYDVGEPGITLQATLKLKEQTLELPVKVDTGASCCLFERRVGEALGFDLRVAGPVRISNLPVAEVVAALVVRYSKFRLAILAKPVEGLVE
jgi:hypothetical protein